MDGATPPAPGRGSRPRSTAGRRARRRRRARATAAPPHDQARTRRSRARRARGGLPGGGRAAPCCGPAGVRAARRSDRRRAAAGRLHAGIWEERARDPLRCTPRRPAVVPPSGAASAGPHSAGRAREVHGRSRSRPTTRRAAPPRALSATVCVIPGRAGLRKRARGATATAGAGSVRARGEAADDCPGDRGLAIATGSLRRGSRARARHEAARLHRERRVGRRPTPASWSRRPHSPAHRSSRCCSRVAMPIPLPIGRPERHPPRRSRRSEPAARIGSSVGHTAAPRSRRRSAARRRRAARPRVPAERCARLRSPQSLIFRSV